MNKEQFKKSFDELIYKGKGLISFLGSSIQKGMIHEDLLRQRFGLGKRVFQSRTDVAPIGRNSYDVERREKSLSNKLNKFLSEAVSIAPEDKIRRIVVSTYDDLIGYHNGTITYHNYPLNKGELYIAHGDWKVFGRISSTLKTTHTRFDEDDRATAIWVLLYDRLALRPSSEITSKLANINKIGLDAAEKILEEIIIDQLNYFSNSTNSQEAIKRYDNQALLKDNKEYRKEVAENTIILAIGDYFTGNFNERFLGLIKQPLYARKIYDIRLNKNEEKEFLPKEFVEKTLEKKVEDEEEAIAMVLNHYVENNKNKYLVALVGATSLKEARQLCLPYKDYIYGHARRPIRIIEIQEPTPENIDYT